MLRCDKAQQHTMLQHQQLNQGRAIAYTAATKELQGVLHRRLKQLLSSNMIHKHNNMPCHRAQNHDECCTAV
jgi:hypothetical protein